MGYLVMILQVEIQGPNFLLFNSHIILWTQRTAENHLHFVYKEERESLKSLPESPRSGRLEVARPLLTTFHSSELSHTCPHLTARESGKCSLCVCLRGQGSTMVTMVHYLCQLPAELLRRRIGISSLQLQILCFFHCTELWDSSVEWLLIQITRTGRGTHTAWGQKRDWKVIQIFFNGLFYFYGHTIAYLIEFSRSHAYLSQSLPKSILEVFDSTMFIMQGIILGRFSSLPIFPSLRTHIWNFFINTSLF